MGVSSPPAGPKAGRVGLLVIWGLQAILVGDHRPSASGEDSPNYFPFGMRTLSRIRRHPSHGISAGVLCNRITPTRLPGNRLRLP